jgi:hypothetical protein
MVYSIRLINELSNLLLVRLIKPLFVQLYYHSRSHDQKTLLVCITITQYNHTLTTGETLELQPY